MSLISFLRRLRDRLPDRFFRFSRRLVGQIWFELSVFLLIVLSTVLLGEELLTPVGSLAWHQLELAQRSLTLVFATELLIRWGASESNRTFVRHCWLDILAILPGFRFFRLGGAFRLLRLLRLVRLIRLVGGRSSLQGGSRLARVAESATVMLIVWVALVVGTFGLAGYENSFHFNLENLLEGFWKAIFSFFSSQYVDTYPKTVGGKVVALFVIVAGTGFFALVTGMTSAILSEKMREGSIVLGDYLLGQLQDHVIICGWNLGGLTALRELQKDPRFAERDIVIICDREEIPELLQIPHPARVRLLKDDFTRVGALQRANLTKAKVALILCDTESGRSEQDADARVVLAALTIEKLNPGVQSCAEISNSENESHLRMGKIDEVIISGEVTGNLLAQAAMNSVGSRILQDLIDPIAGCNLRPHYVAPEWQGKLFGEILSSYHEKTGCTPVAVACGGGMVHLNPLNYRLQADDQLFCLEGDSVWDCHRSPE